MRSLFAFANEPTSTPRYPSLRRGAVSTFRLFAIADPVEGWCLSPSKAGAELVEGIS